MKFSSTVANRFSWLNLRPAPVTPLAASTITPCALDHAGCHERLEGQRGGRDVAPGRGDEPGPLELVAVLLGQPVHRVGQQFRLVVLEPVERRVLRAVLQAVRGREVDDAADMADQLRRQRHARLVREPEEHQVESAGALDVERLEDQPGVGAGERRVQRRGWDARLRVAGGVDHVEVGMLRGEAQQLGAGVARRPDDADADHAA